MAHVFAAHVFAAQGFTANGFAIHGFTAQGFAAYPCAAQGSFHPKTIFEIFNPYQIWSKFCLFSYFVAQDTINFATILLQLTPYEKHGENVLHMLYIIKWNF